MSAVNFQKLPSVLVRGGDQSVTLRCDQDNSQNYYMFWYRHPAGSGKMELVAFSAGQDTASIEAPFNKTKYTMTRPEVLRTSLQIHSPEAADSAVYYCASSLGATSEAYFGAGTKLTVLEDDLYVTPPTVRILPPSKEIRKDKEGNVKGRTLVCMASGFYPDHVNMTWESDNIGKVSTDAAATREDKYYKITSRLTVSNKDWIEAKTKFKCIVNFFDGTKHIIKDDVFTIKPPLIPDMTRGKYVKITQNAKLSYTVLIVKSCLYAALVCFLVWKLKGKREKPTK
ncbi:M1-specific T cell receptor beta chain-like [Poeciliopsis prolifica]|uniref:M1-specific T cell receptor beta chain-like n=1 Tax=Poeciliopsis prolifica TaxID=188132 RepID=UPI002413EA4B|nr:M1-specific T cell receptor beta chain-like [Poeciliopsis prolifica]